MIKLTAASPNTLFLQEVDDFFEQEKTFLLDYFSKIKDSTAKAEKMTRSHKSISFYISISKTTVRVTRLFTELCFVYFLFFQILQMITFTSLPL